MTAGDGQPGLPPFQLEVARMFFALPASRGFLLAGGAALLAQHLTANVRVLADMIATLDRFTDSEIPVPDGSSAAELRAFYAAWRSELAA